MMMAAKKKTAVTPAPPAPAAPTDDAPAKPEPAAPKEPKTAALSIKCNNDKCADGKMKLMGSQYVCAKCGWCTRHDHKAHGPLAKK